MSEFNINGKTLSDLSHSIQVRRKGQLESNGNGRGDEIRELCAPACRLREVSADKHFNKNNWLKRLVRFLVPGEKTR